MGLNIFYVFKSIAIITLTDTPIVPLASGNLLKVVQPHFEYFLSLTWKQPFLQGTLVPFWWKMILRIWALEVIIPIELALVSKAFQWTELKNCFLKIKCIMGSFHFRCKNTFFFTLLMSYLYLCSFLLKIPVPYISIISHSLLHIQDSENDTTTTNISVMTENGLSYFTFYSSCS